MRSAPIPCVVALSLCLLAACAEPTETRSGTGGAGGAKLTAVYSRAASDYARVQNPDGSFQPESFVLKSGGNFGGPRADETMDKLSFEDISKVVAGALASENYVPADDPAATRLLIVVYWGVTLAPDDVNPRSNRSSARLSELAQRAQEEASETSAKDPGELAAARARARSYQEQAQSMANMEANQDAKIDEKNADILGYTDEIVRDSSSNPNLGTLQEEVERDRYYVVLLAYDYQAAARNLGEHKLLWETRFSIPEPGNDFEKAFPLMTSLAARYFGQDTHGLIHHDIAEGHVDVGETKSLGPVPAK
jgi:hypothetical protein